MKPFHSRTWQIVAALVIFASIGLYFYFELMGRSYPLGWRFSENGHRIATLGDYVRYKQDPERFFKDPKELVTFDCERIRDDFVKLTQSIVSPELSTSAETMVWREGNALHLADPSVAGHEAFASWKHQITNLATIQHPPGASHYGTLLQALFTTVTISGRNSAAEYSVETKRVTRFDACE